jgi:hypothetical protein
MELPQVLNGRVSAPGRSACAAGAVAMTASSSASRTIRSMARGATRLAGKPYRWMRKAGVIPVRVACSFAILDPDGDDAYVYAFGLAESDDFWADVA